MNCVLKTNTVEHLVDLACLSSPCALPKWEKKNGKKKKKEQK